MHNVVVASLARTVLGARAVERTRGTLLVFTVAIVSAACTGSKVSAPPPARASPLAVAPLVGVEPIALQLIDAPGFAAEVLTARLRDAMVRTSGAEVIDAGSVRAEVAACHVAPCAEDLQQRYRAARFVVSATLSRVGDVVLASAVLVSGANELVRVTRQGPEAGDVADTLGWELGARFRAVVATVSTTAETPRGER